MLAAAPGQRATVEVALAVIEDSPRKRSVGYVRIVPPPAMAFITPAPAEEKSRAVIWPAVMRKAGILWWRLQRPHPAHSQRGEGEDQSSSLGTNAGPA